MAVGDWDEPCRTALLEQLTIDSEALDNLTMMLFGPDYSTDKATVALIVDLQRYVTRIEARLSESGDRAATETVAIALRKAVEVIAPD